MVQTAQMKTESDPKMANEGVSQRRNLGEKAESAPGARSSHECHHARVIGLRANDHPASLAAA